MVTIWPRSEQRSTRRLLFHFADAEGEPGCGTLPYPRSAWLLDKPGAAARKVMATKAARR